MKYKLIRYIFTNFLYNSIKFKLDYFNKYYIFIIFVHVLLYLYYKIKFILKLKFSLFFKLFYYKNVIVFH